MAPLSRRPCGSERVGIRYDIATKWSSQVVMPNPLVFWIGPAVVCGRPQVRSALGSGRVWRAPCCSGRCGWTRRAGGATAPMHRRSALPGSDAAANTVPVGSCGLCGATRRSPRSASGARGGGRAGISSASPPARDRSSSNRSEVKGRASPADAAAGPCIPPSPLGPAFPRARLQGRTLALQWSVHPPSSPSARAAARATYHLNTSSNQVMMPASPTFSPGGWGKSAGIWVMAPVLCSFFNL